MFPVADYEEVGGGDDYVDDNLSHLVKTDQIPSSLLKDILLTFHFTTTTLQTFSTGKLTKCLMKKQKLMILSQ